MKSSDFKTAWGLDAAARGREKKYKEKPLLLSSNPPKTI